MIVFDRDYAGPIEVGDQNECFSFIVAEHTLVECDIVFSTPYPAEWKSEEEISSVDFVFQCSSQEPRRKRFVRDFCTETLISGRPMWFQRHSQHQQPEKVKCGCLEHSGWYESDQCIVTRCVGEELVQAIYAKRRLQCSDGSVVTQSSEIDIAASTTGDALGLSAQGDTVPYSTSLNDSTGGAVSFARLFFTQTSRSSVSRSTFVSKVREFDRE